MGIYALWLNILVGIATGIMVGSYDLSTPALQPVAFAMQTTAESCGLPPPAEHASTVSSKLKSGYPWLTALQGQPGLYSRIRQCHPR